MRTITIHVWRDGVHQGALNTFAQDNAAASASGDYRQLERHAGAVAEHMATYWTGRYGDAEFTIRVIDSSKDAAPGKPSDRAEEPKEQAASSALAQETVS